MQVPVVPVTSDAEKNILTGELSFDGFDPVLSEDLKDVSSAIREISSGSEERGTVLIMDVKGIRRKSLDEVLLKHLRVRGTNFWFMTVVEKIQDLYDASYTGAEMIFFPMHLLSKDVGLESITEESDTAVPVLFVKDNKVLIDRHSARSFGSAEELAEYSEMLLDMGAARVCIFDIDGSLNGRWGAFDKHWVIPYHCPDDFEDVLTDRP